MKTPRSVSPRKRGIAKKPTVTMAVAKAASVISKPTLQIDHYRYQRRERNSDAASRDSEAILLLLLERRRKERASRKANLPTVITTSAGKVWKQTRGDKLVYHDCSCPNQLLHVIPADTTDNNDAQEAKGLRRPAPLPYVGVRLPVAPSLPPGPKPRYLVRPRFPMNTK